MNKVLQEYLSKVNSLHMLEPKHLPLNLLASMGKMDSQELFKVCTQLFILKSNIPTKNSLINLSEEEIEKGATQYAKEILSRIQKKSHS